jgi:SAM-dependent methyltransferase
LKRRRSGARPVRPNSVGRGIVSSAHAASYGDWWEANRAALIRECVPTPRAAHRLVLDVGCGSGYVLSAEAGIDAEFKVGVDAWRSSAWMPSTGSAFVVADVTQLPLRDGVADLVLSLDVIEHLEDDRVGLAEAARVLRPGGTAVVMVPAFKVLWSSHDDAIGHHRRYRQGDLDHLLAATGLESVQRSYFFSWLFPVALVRRALRLGGESDATPAPLAPLAHVLGRLERSLIRHGIPIPFGSSVFTHAVRPDRLVDNASPRRR